MKKNLNKFDKIQGNTKAGLFDMPKLEETSLEYFERQQGWSEIDLFLDDEIKEAKYYRDVIHRLINTSENDAVRVFINSGGGDLQGALALIDAFQGCEADVTAVITGEAASAASLIALACDNIAISPNARIMIHTASYGLRDSAHVVNSRVQHNQEWFERIFYEHYADFLTEEEIHDVLQGKEIWMFDDEISERLQKRQEIRLERLKDQQEALDNEEYQDMTDDDLDTALQAVKEILQEELEQTEGKL